MGKRQRKIEAEVAAGVFDAFGMAGWTLAAELLAVLTKEKVLTEKQARRVIDGALRSTDHLDEQAPHPAFKVTMEILKGQIEGWDKGRR
jgi:hypothetical protein